MWIHVFLWYAFGIADDEFDSSRIFIYGSFISLHSSKSGLCSSDVGREGEEVVLIHFKSTWHGLGETLLDVFEGDNGQGTSTIVDDLLLQGHQQHI